MKQEKQLLLDELQELVQESGSFLLIEYKKLTSELTQNLRRSLKGVGGQMQIARKRVIAKSMESQGIHLDLTALPGHIALVLTGSDPLEVTKAVYKFGKENEKVVSVHAGHLYGQLYHAQQVEKLSQLPDIHGMRSQLLATFEAPQAQTVATMEAILCSVMHCLENKCQESQQEHESE